jgi:hypothetical protein
LVRRIPARRFSTAQVGAGEADRNPFRLAISSLTAVQWRGGRPPSMQRPLKAFDESAGVGSDCRFPFGAAPERSKEHGQRLLKQ